MSRLTNTLSALLVEADITNEQTASCKLCGAACREIDKADCGACFWHEVHYSVDDKVIAVVKDGKRKDIDKGKVVRIRIYARSGDHGRDTYPLGKRKAFPRKRR